MSRNFLLAAASILLLWTAPTVTAAATTHTTHTQSATAAKTKVASSKVVPSNSASNKTASAKTTPANTASIKTSAKDMHHHHNMAKKGSPRKTAKNMSIQGNREVRALNALEAAGYRQFNNLHAKGADFVTTAMKAGKSYSVTVTSAGRIEATRA